MRFKNFNSSGNGQTTWKKKTIYSSFYITFFTTVDIDDQAYICFRDAHGFNMENAYVHEYNKIPNVIYNSNNTLSARYCIIIL